MHAAAGADAKAVDCREDRECRRGDQRITDGPVRELEKIARKSYSDRCHAASLNDQEQDPAVKKGDARMERFTQVSVLTADDWQTRGEFGVDKTAEEGNHAAGNPYCQDEERSVDAFGDEVGIDENSRADDAAHHSHGGAEEAEMPREAAAGRSAVA